MFKVRRSRASRGSILLVSRMTKSHRNHPDPGETSGSAAANQTSSPANQEERSTSRTLTTTPPPPSGPPKPTRSTRSPPGRTCAGARSSFTTCPARLSSRWCSISARLVGVYWVISVFPAGPNRRRATTGSSCQADSATPYPCPPNSPSQRSSTLQELLALTITVLSPATPTSSLPLSQVSASVSFKMLFTT